MHFVPNMLCVVDYFASRSTNVAENLTILEYGMLNHAF